MLMLGTGGLTLYKAAQRFFVPFEPEVDGFTFAAAMVSALVVPGCGPISVSWARAAAV